MALPPNDFIAFSRQPLASRHHLTLMNTPTHLFYLMVTDPPSFLIKQFIFSLKIITALSSNSEFFIIIFKSFILHGFQISNPSYSIRGGYYFVFFFFFFFFLFCFCFCSHEKPLYLKLIIVDNSFIYMRSIQQNMVPSNFPPLAIKKKKWLLSSTLRESIFTVKILTFWPF